MISSDERNSNLDRKTVEAFGREWSAFDQAGMTEAEGETLFARYFKIFPWERLPPSAVGIDFGCGSGRWALLVSRRVGRLYCIDASPLAASVAKKRLRDSRNCDVLCASVGALPLKAESADFAYALGVLHHVPDTAAALKACARQLRRGAPLLVYLYYALENRPVWYRALWRVSDIFRRALSAAPFAVRSLASQGIALAVYLPLARLARLAERRGRDVRNFPLASYRDLSLYSMRTDALDRFATRLEKRFTADQIRSMMEEAGFERVEFSPSFPFWCALGYRSAQS